MHEAGKVDSGGGKVGREEKGRDVKKGMEGREGRMGRRREGKGREGGMKLERFRKETERW